MAILLYKNFHKFSKTHYIFSYNIQRPQIETALEYVIPRIRFVIFNAVWKNNSIIYP